MQFTRGILCEVQACKSVKEESRLQLGLFGYEPTVPACRYCLNYADLDVSPVIGLYSSLKLTVPNAGFSSNILELFCIELLDTLSSWN